MAKTATLYDNFLSTSLTTSKWDAYNSGHTHSWLSTGGQVNYAASSGASMYATIESDNAYDFTGSYIMLQTLAVPSSSTNAQAKMALFDSGGTNAVYLLYDAGTLYATKLVSGVQTNLATVTYNATTTKWWRLYQSGTTTYWQYGSNGTSWTTLYSATNPITITSLHPLIEGTTYKAETSPGTFKWSYFNGVAQTVTATGLSTAETFGTMAITRNFTIYPNGITTGEEFGTLAFAYDQTLTPTGLASAEAFGSASIISPPLTSTAYSRVAKPTTAYSEEVV